MLSVRKNLIRPLLFVNEVFTYILCWYGMLMEMLIVKKYIFETNRLKKQLDKSFILKDIEITKQIKREINIDFHNNIILKYYCRDSK